jgi:Protein of unknown function (DUF1592)/Protein of unknown function (DUF1588)/Protein of unknown function (DUF1595)/Protein of unknown function (DUF1587)/Protein of unknown function (DUF1585)
MRCLDTGSTAPAPARADCLHAFARGPALIALALAGALFGAACAGEGGGPDDGETDGDEADAGPTIELAPLRMRRLLDRQYVNSVRALLGEEVASVAAPPENLISHGFEAIGAAEVKLPALSVKRYEESARAIGEQAILDLRVLAPYMECEPSGPDDAACMTQFVESFGRRALRRPLEPDEVERYTELGVATAADFASFYAGVSHVISAALQSPSFLYQIEVGEADPDDPTRRRLTGYEMATRLSFFLLDTTPSNELLDMAESGALADAEGVRAAAEEMLQEDAARGALAAYYEERFRLRSLVGLSKDPKTYPIYNQELAAAMRQEALELLAHIVWEEDLDYRELFTARYAFVNADLAELYGVEPPEDPEAFERRELPAEGGRMGVLGQAGFLALHAHPRLTSPTRRGRFVIERLLCTDVPPPPPDVNPLLPEDPGRPETMRQKLSRHMEDEACAGCHKMMDPVGLGLEHFDAIGGFRPDDRGMALDVSGEIADVGPFEGLAGLAELLVSLPSLDTCWVRNLYRHATAHVEGAYELPLIEELSGSFAQSGHRVRQLLIDLVSGPGFRYAAAQEEE